MGDGIDTRVSDAKRQADWDDLQNELAGNETGRMKRFLGPGDDRSPEAKRKKRERDLHRQMLADLLLDPVYKAKYDLAWSTLRKAEGAVVSALDRIDRDIVKAKSKLDDMEDRAARVPGGDLVFRDQNGIVRYANGDVVADDLAATILWSGNEPSFEDYRDMSEHLSALQAQRRDVEAYETDVLGHARDRLGDENDPLSMEELDAMVERIQLNSPTALGKMADASSPVMPAAESVASISVPVIMIGN